MEPRLKSVFKDGYIKVKQHGC